MPELELFELWDKFHIEIVKSIKKIYESELV